MKRGRISQTALKVAISLVTLNEKPGWRERLPSGMAELTERLLVASGALGYGPLSMRLSKKPWMIRLYRLQEPLMPGQFEAFGHRKIFVQRQVEEAIDRGARQVVVVGAGFDTLCSRLAPRYPQVVFLEVDHPATSAAKARGVEGEGRPKNMILKAVDLGERRLSEALGDEALWDPQQQSVLVAEGLLQYLDEQQVRALLVDAASCTAAKSRFVLTHAIPGYRKLVTILTKLIGEPWKSAIRSEDLPQFVASTGWKIVSDIDRDPAHGIERYAVAERLESPS